MYTKIRNNSKPAKFKNLSYLRSTLIYVYLPATIFLAFVYVIAKATKTDVSYFINDPLAITNAPFYTGLVSNIGVLFWCATVAICLFSWIVLKTIRTVKAFEFSSFFLSSGLISLLLLIDDFFMIHENIPDILSQRELLIFGIYGTAILSYLVKFRKTILKTDFLLLLIALILMTLSLIIDKVADTIIKIIPNYFLLNNSLIELVFTDNYDSHVLLEDGLKLFAILSWFMYFTSICMQQIKQAILSHQTDSY